jgi:putative ABC transport system substrate-binding protein
MIRRALLLTAAAATFAAVVSFAGLTEAQAQAPAPKRITIAYLAGGSYNPDTQANLDTLMEGLKGLGLVAGRDFDFVTRYGDSLRERQDAMARELVAMKPDVILAQGNTVPLAAKQATTTMPIVAVVSETEALTTFSNLMRPTGNVTGLITVPANLPQKQMELAREVFPNLARMGWIDWTQTNTDWPLRQRLVDETVKTLNVSQIRAEVTAANDLPGAFDKLVRERAEVVVLPAATLFTAERPRIFDFLAQQKMLAVWSGRAAVEAGGSMAYGASTAFAFRDAAPFIAKIIGGAKPGDLPVNENPTIELAVNLKTAAALGVTIAPAVVARADVVIR